LPAVKIKRAFAAKMKIKFAPVFLKNRCPFRRRLFVYGSRNNCHDTSRNGVFMKHSWREANHTGGQMPNFMLLLHESPSDFPNVSPEEMQQITGEYIAWRRKIEAEGKYVGSNKLKDEGGRHVSMRNGQARVVDGPFAEAKEVMGGYFIITAADYDEAVATSKSCPHLKFGGWIEIRETDPVG
jgi:hypothetical protein